MDFTEASTTSHTNSYIATTGVQPAEILPPVSSPYGGQSPSNAHSSLEPRLFGWTWSWWSGLHPEKLNAPKPAAAAEEAAVPKEVAAPKEVPVAPRSIAIGESLPSSRLQRRLFGWTWSWWSGFHPEKFPTPKPAPAAIPKKVAILKEVELTRRSIVTIPQILSPNSPHLHRRVGPFRLPFKSTTPKATTSPKEVAPVINSGDRLNTYGGGPDKMEGVPTKPIAINEGDRLNTYGGRPEN